VPFEPGEDLDKIKQINERSCYIMLDELKKRRKPTLKLIKDDNQFTELTDVLTKDGIYKIKDRAVQMLYTNLYRRRDQENILPEN
jgi:hypothetical protein